MFLQFARFPFFPSQPDDPNLELVNILLFQTFRFCVSDLFSFVLSECLKFHSSVSPRSQGRRGIEVALTFLFSRDWVGPLAYPLGGLNKIFAFAVASVFVLFAFCNLRVFLFGCKQRGATLAFSRLRATSFL